MTTKLNQKLNYAIESKNLITEALQRKGAKISNETPLRQFPEAIDTLKTTSLSKDIISAYPFNKGDKVMIQEHQHNLPLQNGSFTGNLVGDFTTHVNNFDCYHQDQIYMGFYNKNFFVYHFDQETQLLSPVQKKPTNISPNNAFKNPIHSHLGSNYVLHPDNDDPFTPLSYPSGGKFSKFDPSNCCFDSKGDYLIQYSYATGSADVLKLNHDETQDSYSYELIQSFTLPSQHYMLNFSKASGDIHTRHTFALGGKTIFKINPETNELSSFNILDYNLPTVTNPDILLFGKNYLILTESAGSSRTIYFIKATAIDETLAIQDDGFYDNPANYTYTIIHSEKAPNMPNEPLCWNKNNIYSPRTAQVNYYIHVEKERIDDISDFSYEFGRSDGYIIYGIYLDENTAVSFAEKSASSSLISTVMCKLYKRENPSLPFQEKQPVFPYSCFFLNELGFGIFNYNSSAFSYKLEKNTPSRSPAFNATITQPFNVYMKNGLLCGYTYDNYMGYNFPTKATFTSLSLREGIKGIVDEDFISDTYLSMAYYIDNQGNAIQLRNADISTVNSSHFIFKYKGEYYLFNFYNKSGVNISGTSQKVTFDIENKTFHLGETNPATGSFTKNTSELLLKVKNKDLWISKTNLFGVKKEENGNLHFMEIHFPPALLEAFNGQTPKYLQTFYDGSCGFLFNNGQTLIAHLEWDETSNTAHLKANTSIQTIYPKIETDGEFYSYLSPFKVYQSFCNQNNSIIHCTYTNPLQKEKHFYHLEENKKENWNTSTVIGVISDSQKKEDENGYQFQNVTLDF